MDELNNFTEDKCPGYKDYKNKNIGKFDRSKFKSEHSFITNRWLEKANENYIKFGNKSEGLDYELIFEGFIFLWVAFNGWMSVTINDPIKYESERKLVEAAGWDKKFRERFDNLIMSDLKIKDEANQFVSVMPIFKTKVLRDYLNINEPWDGKDRECFRQKCFSKGDINEKLRNGKEYYQPFCYREHKEQDGNIRIPLDWAHILISIYQVRCDLFHGSKNYYYYGDKKFVEHAFKILWSVWGLGQLK